MIRFILKRLALAVPTIVLVTAMVFLFMELSPADPVAALAGDNPSPERLAEIRASLGLDQPVYTRYLDWAASALRGDLGTSPIKHQSVVSELMFRIPVTGSLVALALLFSIVMGVVFGTISALKRGGVVDWCVNSIANFLMAIPPFLAAVLLVLLFALTLPLFPAIGYASMGDGLGPWLQYSTLPALALAIIPGALVTRQVRGALIDTMEEDYIRTARAKGLRRAAVVGKHAAKNAAIPVVTVMGLLVTSMFGGAVVVERIFGVPGLGSLSVDAVLTGDVVMLQGLVLVVALLVTLVNLLVDASYGYFNPRLRVR